MRAAITNVRFWLGMTISVVALVVAFSRVDFGEALDAFRDANYLWLMPAIACAVLSLVCRSLRWRGLLHPSGVRLGDLFGILMVGYTVTAVLPFRLGDLVRVFLVGRMHAVSKVRTLATIVVERVLDVLAVLVILLTLTPFVPMTARVRTVMWAGTAVIGLIIATIVVVWLLRANVLRFLNRDSRWLPEQARVSAANHAGSAIEGLSVLGDRRMMVSTLGWTAGTWLSGGGLMWAMLVAFGLPHSPAIALFLVAMSALSMVIPSSPGFVGVYHALLIETLVTVFDAPRGASASYAVMTHLLLFAPTVILGAAYMIREPAIWDQLLRFRRERQDEQTPVASV